MHPVPSTLHRALRAAIPLLALHAAVATAQSTPPSATFKPTVLHRFSGTTEATALGGMPESPPVIGADGVLRGVTRVAGPAVSLILPQGAVYAIDPTGATPYSWQLLGNLSGMTTTLVKGADGTLYGGNALSNVNNTSMFGGTPALFSIKSGTPALVFQPTSGPRGQIAMDDQGRIYAGSAETTITCSTTTRSPLYRLNPDGTETKVLDFCDYATTEGSNQRHAKGSGAIAHVWSTADQALYMLASNGGRAVVDATMTSDSAGRSVGTLVRISKAALDAGAANGGAIPADDILVLHDFLRNRDGEPTVAGARITALVEAGDWLYGTSYANPTTSGTTNSQIFSGTVWRVKKTDPSSFKVLHTFRGTDTIGRDGTAEGDASTPNGPLVLAADGNLYGTTSRDGSTVNVSARGIVTPVGAGALYRIVVGQAADRSDDQYELLHRFDMGTEGANPVGLTAGPVAGGVQKLYGAATAGGSGETVAPTSLSYAGQGTVFSIDVPLPTASFTTPFAASAATAKVGDRITLTWATDNVSTCTAGGDNGDTWKGAQQASASAVPLAAALSKVGENTFTLSCESLNGGPAIEQSVTVTVEAQAVVVPPVVDAGGDSGGGAIAPWLLAPFAGLFGLLFATRRRRA